MPLTKAHLLKRKEKLYQWMYRFTQNLCDRCAVSGCACKDTICAHVVEQAAKLGHRFSPTGHSLRCIGSQGCIVPPHLRETCTLYICEYAMSQPGFPREKYERLKNLCARVELKLMDN